MREGGALKVANFEKVRMFGASQRRNASTFAELFVQFEYNVRLSPKFPKIRTLALVVFVP